MTDTDLILKAYDLLDNLTPLKSDCGRLCDAACCKGNDDAGMLLFPGEEKLYADDENFKIIYTQKYPLLICDGTCSRDKRPLSCRIFPLAIVNDGGFVYVIADPRSIPVCPLYRQALSDKLDISFKKAVKNVAKLLCQSNSVKEFLTYINNVCKDTEKYYKL